MTIGNYINMAGLHFVFVRAFSGVYLVMDQNTRGTGPGIIRAYATLRAAIEAAQAYLGYLNTKTTNFVVVHNIPKEWS